MTITAGQVKELREKTGVGMMECKKALEENSGDMEKAIIWLRERGVSRAAKKADRIAAEGVVAAVVNDDANAGVVLEVNCETDFTSNNDFFRQFVRDAAAAALKTRCNDIEKLANEKLASGKTVQDTLTDLIQKIGENMRIRRVSFVSTQNGAVGSYIHMGGKIGTLVVLDGAKNGDVLALAKDLAMHVAAASPRYLTSGDVNTAELEQEKELSRKKLIEEKKPEAMIEKIVDGQMKKFFKEVCLVEQAFVKDPNVNITSLVAKVSPQLKVSNFHRFALGEGIEKKKEDFAAEVAAQLG